MTDFNYLTLMNNFKIFTAIIVKEDDNYMALYPKSYVSSQAN